MEKLRQGPVLHLGEKYWTMMMMGVQWIQVAQDVVYCWVPINMVTKP